MPGTGYVSIADYMDANQGTLDRERGDLQNYVGNESGQAQGAADDLIKSAVPGSGDYTQTAGYGAAVDKANKAQQDQTGLQTYGGVADLINRIYGGSKEGASFDAGLLGPQAGGQKSNLLDYLNGGLAFATRDLAPATGSGTSDARHNRPHGPANPTDPTQPAAPTTDPWYDDHPRGPEDAPIDNQNPWGGGGG